MTRTPYDSWSYDSLPRFSVFADDGAEDPDVTVSRLPCPMQQSPQWFLSTVLGSHSPGQVVFLRRTDRAYWLRCPTRCLVLSACGTPVGPGDIIHCHNTSRREAMYARGGVYVIVEHRSPTVLLRCRASGRTFSVAESEVRRCFRTEAYFNLEEVMGCHFPGQSVCVVLARRFDATVRLPPPRILHELSDDILLVGGREVLRRCNVADAVTACWSVPPVWEDVVGSIHRGCNSLLDKTKRENNTSS